MTTLHPILLVHWMCLLTMNRILFSFSWFLTVLNVVFPITYLGTLLQYLCVSMCLALFTVWYQFRLFGVSLFLFYIPTCFNFHIFTNTRCKHEHIEGVFGLPIQFVHNYFIPSIF